MPKTEYQWGINGGIFLLYALTGMAIIFCIFFLLKFNMDYDWLAVFDGPQLTIGQFINHLVNRG